MSTAVVTLMLPQDMETTSNIATAPASGSFEDITGVWAVQRITPELYSSVGFSGSDLKGNDVYQIVLQNAPELDNVAYGQVIPLFTFELTGDCTEGTISVLNNNSSVQQSIINNLRANFNNQMSLSIDDAPSRDLYVENNPFTDEVDCPLNSTTTSSVDIDASTRIRLQPNPTVDYLDVFIQNNALSTVNVEIYDVNHVTHYSNVFQLITGENKLHLESVRNLAPGTYILQVSDEQHTYQKKFIKVNY